jgi:hypothetical protein
MPLKNDQVGSLLMPMLHRVRFTALLKRLRCRLMAPIGSRAMFLTFVRNDNGCELTRSHGELLPRIRVIGANQANGVA